MGWMAVIPVVVFLGFLWVANALVRKRLLGPGRLVSGKGAPASLLRPYGDIPDVSALGVQLQAHSFLGHGQSVWVIGLPDGRRLLVGGGREGLRTLAELTGAAPADALIPEP